MDEGMKALVFAIRREFDAIEASERVTKNNFLQEHVAGMRKASEKDGLKGLVMYAATNPILEDVLEQVNDVTLQILEKIKPKGSDLAKLLGDDNIEVAGTAGFCLMQLLDREALDKKELRGSKEFAEALSKMKKSGDEDLKNLARILEKKVGMMESRGAADSQMRAMVKRNPGGVPADGVPKAKKGRKQPGSK